MIDELGRSRPKRVPDSDPPRQVPAGVGQVQKIEEHERKYNRRKLEKELREVRRRIRKLKDSQEKKDGKQSSYEGLANAFEWESSVMESPEVMAAIQDPEVMEAFAAASRNPPSILKYHNNPKVKAVMQKLSGEFSGRILGELADAMKSRATA